MKEIRAIIRPNRLARLRDALRQIPNFPGVTVLRAEGFTAPASIGKRTVKEELIDFSEKVMVTVLADDDMVDVIRDAIFDTCHSGMIGDGLVWVVDIEVMYSIRQKAPY